jgi:hypothetical protein
MANGQLDDPTAAALRAVEQELGSLKGSPKKPPQRTMAAEAFHAADHMEWVGKQALEEATAFYETCHRLANELRRETESYAHRTVSPKFFNGGGDGGA